MNDPTAKHPAARFNSRCPLLRLTAPVIALSTLFSEPAAAQSVATDSSPIEERNPLSIGLYAGELYKSEYLDVLYQPWDLRLTPSYLVALNVVYRIHRFDSLPLQLEGEFDVAKRFHGADQYDIVLTPFVRWTSFPWNRVLYTNARISALGPSYTTGVSAWEREKSGNDHGSNLLDFSALEVTFAASENARSEVFLRVHHRSGIYGLINGVRAGSNYLALGFRVFL